MPSDLAIPLVFPGAPPELKRDLERQSTELDKFARELPLKYRPRWRFEKQIAVADTFAAFDTVTRIAPRTDQTIVCQLPRANVKDGGRELRVQRMNADGHIYLVPPDALVNGDDRYHMLNSIGFVTVMWDGTGYYTEHPGAAP